MEAMSGYELNLRCISCLCCPPYNTQVCQRQEIRPFFSAVASTNILTRYKGVLGLASPLRGRYRFFTRSTLSLRFGFILC